LLQLEFEVAAARLAAAEAALEGAGALSVSLADPGGEPVLEPAPGETPLWEAVRVSALFHPSCEPAALRREIATATGLPLAAVTATPLASRDWVREFRETLQPLSFGGRLWICPTGVACPEPAAIRLELEPGLAFGSGAHATTALCLDWLAGLELQGRRVLDWGCGSGVLAIAALALGATGATAVDIDPQALLATRQNAQRNDRGAGLAVHDAAQLTAPGTLARHDVLVANILANALIELAPRLRQHCATGAPVALSGILDAQAARVATACAPYFRLHPSAHRDGWALLSGQAI
jgi:ribosomal protein L11 methyltransferase